jgi:diguanylate cyclase (GGDEF)-like protein/PAS domain S-box-containing protein
MRSLSDAKTLIDFVHKLSEGVYITSADGRILDANAAFLEMFGVVSLEAMRAHTAGSLLVDPARRAEQTRMLEATGFVREYELEIRRPDGYRRTVLDTAYRVIEPETGEVLYHGILVDITDRKILEQQLRELATRDPLTGCHNRRSLQQLTLRLERSAEPLGVIVADIDSFKAYNDTYGHDLGDKLLVQVSRFFTRNVRSEDAVVRTGGDEFAILLPGLDESATRDVVARLHASGPESAPVSFTLGWAMRDGRERVEETLRRADQDLIRVRVAERKPQRRK